MQRMTVVERGPRRDAPRGHQAARARVGLDGCEPRARRRRCTATPDRARLARRARARVPAARPDAIGAGPDGQRARRALGRRAGGAGRQRARPRRLRARRDRHAPALRLPRVPQHVQAAPRAERRRVLEPLLLLLQGADGRVLLLPDLRRRRPRFSQRTRIFLAIMAAAAVGNLYYHLLRDITALRDARSTCEPPPGAGSAARATYSLFLALGIYVSMMREQARRGRKAPRRRPRHTAPRPRHRGRLALLRRPARVERRLDETTASASGSGSRSASSASRGLRACMSSAAVGVVAVNSPDFVATMLAYLERGRRRASRSAIARTSSASASPASGRSSSRGPGHGWLDLRHRPREDGSVAQILFTSGTEGEPKGVVLTHGALADVVARLNDVMRRRRVDPRVRRRSRLSLLRLRPLPRRRGRGGEGVRPGARLQPDGDRRDARARRDQRALGGAEPVARRAREPRDLRRLPSPPALGGDRQPAR